MDNLGSRSTESLWTAIWLFDTRAELLVFIICFTYRFNVYA